MKNKVICLGDSITKGKVWYENERRPHITESSYPYILKTMIGIDVLNNGICDITSEQMLQNIGKEIKIERENLVIVEIGGNDCNLNWRKIKGNPDGEHDAIVPLENFKHNLLKILDTICCCGAIPVLSTLPPLDGERYYNLLKRVFGDGIKRWIDRNGGIYKWQERYSNMIKAVAETTSTFLVDVRKSFLDTEDYRKLMSFDGIHPNEEGYRLIAKTCSRDLRLLLGL